MARLRTRDEIQRLKAHGVFDVGTWYLPRTGFETVPVHEFWDREEPLPKKRIPNG